MYKLRYGRTFNLGGYQSERIELERDIPDDFPEDEAYELLRAAVLRLQARREAQKAEKEETSHA